MGCDLALPAGRAGGGQVSSVEPEGDLVICMFQLLHFYLPKKGTELVLIYNICIF